MNPVKPFKPADFEKLFSNQQETNPANSNNSAIPTSVIAFGFIVLIGGCAFYLYQRKLNQQFSELIISVKRLDESDSKSG